MKIIALKWCVNNKILNTFFIVNNIAALNVVLFLSVLKVSITTAIPSAFGKICYYRPSLPHHLCLLTNPPVDIVTNRSQFITHQDLSVRRPQPNEVLN